MRDFRNQDARRGCPKAAVASELRERLGQMSTRSSIWWTQDEAENPQLHLYEEMLDGTICLDIQSGPTHTVFALPPEMIRKIQNSETCHTYAIHGNTDPA